MTREVKEVAEFAAGLPERFLLCREMGHNWRPYSARWSGELGGYERTLRCSRCRTERRQTLSQTGAVLTSGYDYPDGYQRHGFGRISGDGRDRLRLESLTRLIDEED